MPVTSLDDVVTLAEAKQHLRVDHDFEDDLIAVYLSAAVADLSAFMRRGILPETRQDFFRAREIFGSGKKVFLRWPNVDEGSIEVSKFDSTAGSYTPVPASDFRVDEPEENPHVVFTSSLTVDDSGADANVLLVGYNTRLPNLPPQVKAAVLLTLGSLYENREDVVVGSRSERVPLSAEYLLGPFRFLRAC